MNPINPILRRCLGRNRNLIRCNRRIEKGLFCYEHKRQPLVFICFIIFTVVVALVTIYSFITTYSLNKERDIIIAEQYRMDLNIFLVKFRISLICLPHYKSLDKDIKEVFDPDHINSKGVQIGKITPELIEKLFTSQNFSKPVNENCKFERLLTTSDLLILEIIALNKRCSDILLKYASSGNPKLIKKIEIMKNRTDNLIGPYGPKNYSQLNKYDLHSISEFFCLIKESYEYINKITPNKYSL